MEKVNKEREETKRHKNELEQRISEVIWPNKLYLESDKLRIHEASWKIVHKNGLFIVLDSFSRVDMFVVKQDYPGEGFCKDSRRGGGGPRLKDGQWEGG